MPPLEIIGPKAESRPRPTDMPAPHRALRWDTFSVPQVVTFLNLWAAVRHGRMAGHDDGERRP